MKGVPSEVLNLIFDFLPQEDHMECMLVCHFWKDVIEQYSLFRDLRIYSTNKLKNFIKKIQEKPALGRNVEQLTCYFDDGSEVDLTKLIEPLCNLRVFNSFGPEDGTLLIDSSTAFLWHTSIERCTQQYPDPIITPIFEASVFPRLTVLDIRENTDSKLIHSLKNAPALKNLTLRSGNISFHKMDTLHESLPNLKTLTLMVKLLFSHTFYKYTAPAKSMIEFNLSCIETFNIQARIDMLRYITIKYPNLVRLLLNSSFFGHSDTEIEQLNHHGWHPLLQNLGSQLKEFQVHYSWDSQTFIDMLDVNSCRIQNLHLISLSPHVVFPNIAQQSIYLKTLVLLLVNPKSFDWLKELKVLESLDMRIDRRVTRLCLDFCDIVKHCPDSLLSLCLGNLELTGEFTNTTQCNVNTLTLEYSYLTQKIDWFISRHFPDLAAFTLRYCKFGIKQFNMKNISLQTFCLIQNMKTNGVTVLVQTNLDSEGRWYETRGIEYYNPFNYFDTGDSPNQYPPVISRSASEIKKEPFFTLQCHSMREIFLCP